jgi:hypothetical protein
MQTVLLPSPSLNSCFELLPLLFTLPSFRVDPLGPMEIMERTDMIIFQHTRARLRSESAKGTIDIHILMTIVYQEVLLGPHRDLYKPL